MIDEGASPEMVHAFVNGMAERVPAADRLA